MITDYERRRLHIKAQLLRNDVDRLLWLIARNDSDPQDLNAALHHMEGAVADIRAIVVDALTEE